MQKRTEIGRNRVSFRIVFVKLLFLSVLIGCINTPMNLKGDKPSEPANLNNSKKTTSIMVDSVNILRNQKSLSQDSLLGRWLRSDGNYILEIFSVTPEGKVDAAYFNPNPINVEKSDWKITENRLFIRVILRDVNYPGSTYTLEYSPVKRSLSGNYYQAVEGINYDVIFARER
jgi:hypothetical protein